MIITKRQLRRVIREAIDFSDREANPHDGEMYGEPEGGHETPHVDHNRAYELIAMLQEYGYELFLPHARGSNQAAVKDALTAHPGEFTYDDLREAIRIVQGRGA